MARLVQERWQAAGAERTMWPLAAQVGAHVPTCRKSGSSSASASARACGSVGTCTWRCLLGFSTAARHEVYSHSTQNLAQNLLTCPPPDKNRRRSKTWRLG